MGVLHQCPEHPVNLPSIPQELGGAPPINHRRRGIDDVNSKSIQIRGRNTKFRKMNFVEKMPRFNLNTIFGEKNMNESRLIG